MLDFPKSRPIVISPYRQAWPAEFADMGQQLRIALDPLALRIDHIGSTAVPGLPAKDVIDIQVTVASLDDRQLVSTLSNAGFRERGGLRNDLYIGIADSQSPDLRKRLFREPAGRRRCHIHIREQGRFNQRYALLFRDYLRAMPVIRDGYGLLKARLAQLFPESIDGYLFIKDPLMDMMFAAAQTWADTISWQPDNQFL